MKNLFRFFILLIAILFSIDASCPEYPTIPTTSPLLITSASEGLSNFPSSTQQLSISMLITPEETCAAGSKFHLFSVNIGTNPDSVVVYIDCDSRVLTTKGSWFGASQNFFSLFSSSALGPVGIFLSFDLNAGGMTVQAQSEKVDTSGWSSFGSPANPYFDTNSKFYFCADKDGASSKACTISDIIVEYRYYPSFEGYAHLAGTDSTIAAFYPLSDQSLATSIGSATSAYFGDNESNPTPATKPTWDSSNSFVTITSGQFLTFPLPDVSSTSPIVSSSFSFAAWIKLTDIPFATTTLFAMYSADGTQVGYKLSVTKSTNEIELTFSSSSIAAQNTVPTITLNQWQLIGFTASVTKTLYFMDGTFFVGTLSAQCAVISGTQYDLSTVSVIRIGDTADSFSGQISAVRIMTPGGGVVRTTDLCSSDNSIELGVGSFALACSGSNYLDADECVSVCPKGTRSTILTAVPLCVPCPDHCATCNNIECLTCETNYPLYQGDCLSSCPDKMYDDGSACQPCPENCAECDASQCKTCDDDYQLNTEKECVLKSSTPTPSPTTITKGKSGLSGGAIAGIACGCIILLLFILLLGGRYFKKKKEGSKRVSTIKFGNPNTSPDSIKATPISPTTSEANPLMP